MTYYAVVNPSQVIHDVFPTEEKAIEHIAVVAHPLTADQWAVYAHHETPPCWACLGCSDEGFSDDCPALMRNNE